MARKPLRRVKAQLLDARAALHQRIRSALDVLQVQGRISDEAVHTVRKELKRARAALRLLRDTIGEAAYAKENTALRDVSRPLAMVRDARVELDTVRRLLKKEKDPKLRGLLAGECRALREERNAARAAVEERRELQDLARALDQASERIGRWRLPRDVWPGLRDGMKRIYRRGRKAIGKTAFRRTDDNLHEARKQVKYFGAAMEILAPAQAQRVARLAKRAESIADDLGDDHDLAVLEGRLARVRDKRSGALINHLQRRRKKLQRNALKRAHRLYRRKPARFLRRLERTPTAA